MGRNGNAEKDGVKTVLSLGIGDTLTFNPWVENVRDTFGRYVR